MAREEKVTLVLDMTSPYVKIEGATSFVSDHYANGDTGGPDSSWSAEEKTSSLQMSSLGDGSVSLNDLVGSADNSSSKSPVPQSTIVVHDGIPTLQMPALNLPSTRLPEKAKTSMNIPRLDLMPKGRNITPSDNVPKNNTTSDSSPVITSKNEHQDSKKDERQDRKSNEKLLMHDTSESIPSKNFLSENLENKKEDSEGAKRNSEFKIKQQTSRMENEMENDAIPQQPDENVDDNVVSKSVEDDQDLASMASGDVDEQSGKGDVVNLDEEDNDANATELEEDVQEESSTPIEQDLEEEKEPSENVDLNVQEEEEANVISEDTGSRDPELEDSAAMVQNLEGEEQDQVSERDHDLDEIDPQFAEKLTGTATTDVEAPQAEPIPDLLTEAVDVNPIHYQQPEIAPVPQRKPLQVDSQRHPQIGVDEMPVTLTFEAGRNKITVGELEKIKEGYTFACENPIEAPVTICANDLPIGMGELIDVDGRIGVRVIKFYNK